MSPCIGRWILNHGTTRRGQQLVLILAQTKHNSEEQSPSVHYVCVSRCFLPSASSRHLSSVTMILPSLFMKLNNWGKPQVQ